MDISGIPPALRPLASQSPYVGSSGPADAPLVLIGEAPGREEAEQLKPFVGPAGALLSRALKAAGIDRRACYITNMVKYRPPRNRTPYQFEILAGRPEVLEEISAVRPAAVVALGAVPRHGLLGSAPSHIGRFSEFRLDSGFAVPVLCTWHPAWALREGAAGEEEIIAHLKLLIEGPYVYAGT